MYPQLPLVTSQSLGLAAACQPAKPCIIYSWWLAEIAVYYSDRVRPSYQWIEHANGYRMAGL
jgi:hypothetical protein